MRTYLFAIGCVLLIGTGQIVFKVAANAAQSAGTFFAVRPVVITGLSFAIYGVASILWILLLQHTPLSRIYPYMALSFVFVPLLAHFFLGDVLGLRYLLGSVIIACGVVVAVSH